MKGLGPLGFCSMRSLFANIFQKRSWEPRGTSQGRLFSRLYPAAMASAMSGHSGLLIKGVSSCKVLLQRMTTLYFLPFSSATVLQEVHPLVWPAVRLATNVTPPNVTLS